MDKKLYNVALTQSQIENLIEFIELDFIDTLRKDTCIDNFSYLVDMIDAYKQLKQVAEDNSFTGNNNCAYKDLCEKESDQKIKDEAKIACISSTDVNDDCPLSFICDNKAGKVFPNLFDGD